MSNQPITANPYGIQVVNHGGQSLRGRAPAALQTGFQQAFTGRTVTGWSGIVPYAKPLAKFTLIPTGS